MNQTLYEYMHIDMHIRRIYECLLKLLWLTTRDEDQLSLLYLFAICLWFEGANRQLLYKWSCSVMVNDFFSLWWILFFAQFFFFCDLFSELFFSCEFFSFVHFFLGWILHFDSLGCKLSIGAFCSARFMVFVV